MLIAIVCIDKPNASDVRAKTRPAHIAYLEANSAKLHFAGPLLSDDGQTGSGSLIVAEFDSLEAAHAFCKADPYAQAGLFESVTVKPTRKVFPAA
jgi:uncharacterized protein YciI